MVGWVVVDVLEEDPNMDDDDNDGAMMILNNDLPVDRAECGKCSHTPEYMLL